ncbi:hypothetical protein [Nocardia inohanensis]|uniref:hypothetical protein n=1 Tax=Nocardia inohanensis TaxID=209246 RepID=UPI000831FB98|nr:hypothetical protein [Nocardia inohanensis]
MTGETGAANWVAVDACTLPSAAQPLRVAEFDELFANALRAVQRVSPTRLRLRLDAAAESEARQLAGRETACCSFFTFEFSTGPAGSIWMEIEVPAARTAVLDALATRTAAGMP